MRDVYMTIIDSKYQYSGI